MLLMALIFLVIFLVTTYTLVLFVTKKPLHVKLPTVGGAKWSTPHLQKNVNAFVYYSNTLPQDSNF